MGGIVNRLALRVGSLWSGVRRRPPSPPVAEIPTPMDENQIRAQLREWIVEHSKSKPAAAGLDDQTPLLETGLLSSLDIVEFVLFIEELRGEEVDTDEIEPEVFTSIDTLVEGFFANAA
ncbi:MAG: acyl carrier protein [Myxococcales bacterium]|nr:acyl carrier protein [Myxococcales bacterium]